MFAVINHKLFKMKKSIFILLLLAVTSISAQEEFYVGLHYFKVKSEYANEFSVENHGSFYMDPVVDFDWDFGPSLDIS